MFFRADQPDIINTITEINNELDDQKGKCFRVPGPTADAEGSTEPRLGWVGSPSTGGQIQHVLPFLTSHTGRQSLHGNALKAEASKAATAAGCLLIHNRSEMKSADAGSKHKRMSLQPSLFKRS